MQFLSKKFSKVLFWGVGNVDIDKLILKFLWKDTVLETAKTIFTKKNEVRAITIDIKPYYVATIMKRVWYWWKNRHID